MKNRLFLLLIAAAAFPMTGTAKPSYQQARAFYDQLKKPFFDTGLFHKKSFQDRVAYLSAAKAVVDKAEKTFGVPSACYSAASARYDYAAHLHDFASRLEGRVTSPLDFQSVTNPMYSAFTYGEHTAACYSEVEALDAKRR